MKTNPATRVIRWFHPGRNRRLLLAAAIGGALIHPGVADPAAERLRGLLDEAGEAKKHLTGPDGEALQRRRQADRNFAELRREQIGGRWFSALVSADPDREFEILRRFDSPAAMTGFLQAREAVVEVWTYATGGKPSRRLTASELSRRALSANPQPTLLTAIFPNPSTGRAEHARVEFGFAAAAHESRQSDSYRRHRLHRNSIRQVLRARDRSGALSARAQWDALRTALGRGDLPLAALPSPPAHDRDLWVACECAVDAAGQIARIERFYRVSQVSQRIVGDTTGLFLRTGGGGKVAVATHLVAGSGVPVAGRDPIAVRIRDDKQPDPRRWNLIEFGEPWILRETGLAQLGLINAYLDDQRRDLAWKKSNFDRFAEPLFAGLNIWGGATSAGYPWGEAVRLAYNATVSTALTPDAPTRQELQDLLRHVAAKSRHPGLRHRPGQNLTPAQVAELRRSGARLSPREVDDALQTIAPPDLAAMLAFPTWHNMDRKYRLFVDILTDYLKVTGNSESGTLKDIFNNSRLSPNGELSITNTLAIALGHESITPLSGASLEQLIDGDAPARSWLQFLNLSVDLRAVANTLSLIARRHQPDRELRTPFGHAPRLGDLAAYEFRLFGYPTLFWHKRDLLKQEIGSYRNDFAYGIHGTRVVERFATRDDFLRELRAGRFLPIGFVRIPGGLQLHGRESSLPVFGHRVRSGRHAGKTAIVIYGLAAYRHHAAFMGRELKRFHQFERMLEDGGVIVRRLDGGDHAEPELRVGREAVATRFTPLLENLLEYQRLLRLARMGVEPDDRTTRSRLESFLRGRGVAAGHGEPDPLLRVDDRFSSFTYRSGKGRVQVVHVPATDDLARGTALADKQRRIEDARRRAAGFGP